MKIAIVGSRPEYQRDEQDMPIPEMTKATLARRRAVRTYVKGLPEGTIVVSGGADGVDTWAAMAAQERGLEVQIYRPDYRLYGQGATLKRNDVIVSVADALVAFWDGQSRGTADTLRRARDRGIPVTVFQG